MEISRDITPGFLKREIKGMGLKIVQENQNICVRYPSHGEKTLRCCV